MPTILTLEAEITIIIAKTPKTGVTGKPFNIASYALLTMMVAQVCDLEVGEFVHTLWDAHLYSNHFDQVATQLAHTPTALPVMKIKTSVKDLFAFSFDDFTLQGMRLILLLRRLLRFDLNWNLIDINEPRGLGK